MAINKDSLQNQINYLSSKTGVHQNILLKSFFFDAFLKRLSLSKYSRNFVFKGGFFLSTSLGINLRSTRDIDFLLKNIKLEKNIICSVIHEIVSINIDDNITFKFNSIMEIREEDSYGGYNVSLTGQLDNINEIISIDIATGDPITPSDVKFQYKCFLDGEMLSFVSYNFETIIAEKLQTILYRGVLNSRSKDFYDLYIIFKLRWNEIDLLTLKNAFDNTCQYRKTIFSKAEAFDILDKIRENSLMKNRWNIYKKRNKYVGDITFDETLETMASIIETIFNISSSKNLNS